MGIRNIQFKSIEASRYMESVSHSQQIDINHNSTITQIHDIRVRQVTIDFQYTASYASMGMIKLEGSLIYEDDNAKKLAISWRSTHKMSDKVASQIHTAVMHACILEAVGIARNLGLPSPIPLPRIRLGEHSKRAEFGPEVA